jgi:Ca2+-transporting ATPase
MFFLATEAPKAHTVVFTGLVMIEFLILQTVRQQYGQKLFGNKYLSLSIALVVLLQLIIIYSPINVLFHSVPLDLHDWSVIIAAIAIVFVFNHFLNKFIKSE